MAVLVTGFPNFMARRLVYRELEEAARSGGTRDGTRRVYVLAQQKHAERAARLIRAHPEGARGEVLVGDVCILDLGLSGTEVRALLSEVAIVHHAAEVSYLGVEPKQAREVNVGGTRMLLDTLVDSTRLRRLVHWSTAFVSGDRRGLILEDELEAGQGFRNQWESSKYEAERLARGASGRLPISIVRPGIVLGDSRTGEVGRFDGPYYLMALMLLAPSDTPVPLPGPGATPLHVAPVDFVEQAALRIAHDDRAAGRTFHLCDPNPLSARRVFELVARSAGRAAPTAALPPGLSRLLLRVPFLERFARSPRQFVEYFDHPALYSCRNTVEILDGTGVACPPFDTYVDAIVAYLREHLERRRRASAGLPQQQQQQQQEDLADAEPGVEGELEEGAAPTLDPRARGSGDAVP